MPATNGVVYTRPVADGQTETGPLIDAGAAGKPDKASVRATLFPQAFTATTLNVPKTKPDGMPIVMAVPVLVRMLQPAAAVQLYELAPATAAMLYE